MATFSCLPVYKQNRHQQQQHFFLKTHTHINQMVSQFCLVANHYNNPL